jgi:hypothetical protein
MYNSTTDKTYWFVDQKNSMISTQCIPNPWDDGHYDGIEKALHAYICYGDERFINGIENCWKWQDKKFVGKRYPDFNWNEAGISRDHTIYSFVAWKLTNYSNEELHNRASHLPFQLGNESGMTMMPNLWLWLRLISGKKIGMLWYPLAMFGKIGSLLQNKIVSILTGFKLKETNQDDFVKADKQSKIDKWLYPTFALKLGAFQLYVLPNSFMKRVLQKLCLWNTPSENFLLKVMFSGKVTQEQIDNYKPMYGDRWSDELNPERTRGMILEIIKNEEHISANTLDKDLLLFIYNKTNE